MILRPLRLAAIAPSTPVLLVALVALVAPATRAAAPWPASADRPVSGPAELAGPSVAAASDGRLIVAFSRYDVASGVEVEVMRSDPGGLEFESLGVFADPSLFLNFAQPEVVLLEQSGRIVLALLEERQDGFAVMVATTPLDGPPQWSTTTAMSGVDLIDPVLIAREDAGHDPELHLLVHVVSVSGAGEAGEPGEPGVAGVAGEAGEPGESSVTGVTGATDPLTVWSGEEDERLLDGRLEYLRSTDGGATWSAPLTLAIASFPTDVRGARIAAGQNGSLHVVYRRGEQGPSGVRDRLEYRRHPARGIGAIPWEEPLQLVGSAADVQACDVAASGEAPTVWAVYRAAASGLRVAWSADGGISFPLTGQQLVAADDDPTAFRVAAFGTDAHLVFRRDGERLVYRSWPLDDPVVPGFESAVSDVGQPVQPPHDLTTRAGHGPAVAWVAGEAGVPAATLYVDAVWFTATAGAGTSGPVAAAGARRLRAAPNPFAASTTLELDLGRDGAGSAPLHGELDPRLEVRIHDVQGRLVRRLVARDAAAGGGTTIIWDGRDARGRPVAPGIYLASTTGRGVPRVSLRLVRLP